MLPASRLLQDFHGIVVIKLFVVFCFFPVSE